jgi:DNA-directed RNA polymerase subunit H (RpoH/RPB5)
MEDKYQQIITEMMDARGYEITEVEADKMVATKDTHNILVISVSDSKLNTNTVKDLVAILEENCLNHAIIVFNDTITSGARKIIELAEQSHKIVIETFNRNELQYNITTHRLQPLFEKCTPQEVSEIKSTCGTKLPIMLKTDPIARFYNYSRGDIIKIIRRNSFVSYRIVK